jgi:hypothetical protein
MGDTAVAVHPEDPRYKQYIGRSCMVPMSGRIIPIIGDTYVDMQFGTGALKITPGHDPNDWALGKKHGLQVCLSNSKTVSLVHICGALDTSINWLCFSKSGLDVITWAQSCPCYSKCPSGAGKDGIYSDVDGPRLLFPSLSVSARQVAKLPSQTCCCAIRQAMS